MKNRRPHLAESSRPVSSVRLLRKSAHFRFRYERASAKAKKTDVVIVDTAGRLHVKDNLMKELQKMDRVVTREYPEADFLKLLVLDATTGQNAVNQARVFDEAVELDGLVLTKLDGTAKGGFVFSLASELALPVIFAGVGEKIEDLEHFDAKSFVEAIL